MPHGRVARPQAMNDRIRALAKQHLAAEQLRLPEQVRILPGLADLGGSKGVSTTAFMTSSGQHQDEMAAAT